MRGRVPVVLAVLLCATVPPLAAQQWTPEQQGLIDHMTQCWDAWVKALADETPHKFFAACPTDPKGHWWWTAEGAPAPLVTVTSSNGNIYGTSTLTTAPAGIASKHVHAMASWPGSSRT